MHLSLFKHRIFKCLAWTFLSLPMPTYWKHCPGKPLTLNTYLHPLVARWFPSGSPTLLPKGYYTSSLARIVRARVRGFLGRLWAWETLCVYRCHITWAFTCLDHMATLAQNRTPTQGQCRKPWGIQELSPCQGLLAFCIWLLLRLRSHMIGKTTNTKCSNFLFLSIPNKHWEIATLCFFSQNNQFT